MKKNDFKAKRLSMDLTQRNLAEQMGLSPQQISNYESGRVSIPHLTSLALKYLLLKKNEQKTKWQNISAQETEQLKNFSHQLRKTFGTNIIMMFVFGSKVRGDSHAESDIDFLIVLKTKSLKDRHKVFDILFELDPFNQHNISPVIYSLADFQMNEQMNSPFITSIKNEGLMI